MQQERLLCLLFCIHREFYTYCSFRGIIFISSFENIFFSQKPFVILESFFMNYFNISNNNFSFFWDCLLCNFSGFECFYCRFYFLLPHNKISASFALLEDLRNYHRHAYVELVFILYQVVDFVLEYKSSLNT